MHLACDYSEVICYLQVPVVRGTAISFGSPHDQHGDHVIGPAAYMILVVGRSSVMTIDTLKDSIAGLRIVMTLLRNYSVIHHGSLPPPSDPPTFYGY